MPSTLRRTSLGSRARTSRQRVGTGPRAIGQLTSRTERGFRGRPSGGPGGRGGHQQPLRAGGPGSATRPLARGLRRRSRLSCRGQTVQIGRMNSMKCRFALVLCVLGVSSAGMSPVGAEPPTCATVAPGIAHAIFEMRPADAEPFSGHAFKIDLEVAELRLVPAGDPSARRTVEQIVAPYPVVVAVNASFFDTQGRAMGLAVDEGRVMASSKQDR